MEQYVINNDIRVMYLTAQKFPDDVPNTYTNLERKIADKTPRRYFGFSHPNKEGVIEYKACVEILVESEPHDYGLETFIIKSGKYASIFIQNHYDDGANIPNAFGKLLKHPKLDPKGYCLEMYKNFTDPDVLCLVPILD